MIVFAMGVVVGAFVGVVAGRYSTHANVSDVTAVDAGTPQVVRCTDETNGFPTDTSADDHWVLVPSTVRTFQSTHGKYFFAPNNYECVVISVPAPKGS
jgi:hypothetical protein